MKYRAEIDGLRALAVVPVILFHAGFSIFSGGFIGVDVFFVISGFLITSIILSEKDNKNFSLLNFYERRVRRILPALFFVMAVCIPFALILLVPKDMKSFGTSLLTVPAFISNLQFWRESGYFDTASELKPLLHTWSLAVEEQYYIFFPVFLMITWRLGKKWILALLLLAGFVSLGLSHWAAYNKPYAAFYLLPTRFWELLIGALIAFYFNIKPDRIAKPKRDQMMSGLGILMILGSVFLYDKNTPFPGTAALVPTVGAALIILFANEGTIAHKLLSKSVCVGIGLISYSAYLWHQPLFAFIKYGSVEELSTWVMLSLCLLSFGLAYLSWKYVETPFRKKGRISRRFIFTISMIIAAIFMASGAYIRKNDGYLPTTNAEALTRAKHIDNLNKERVGSINSGVCHFNKLGAHQNIDSFVKNWKCTGRDEKGLSPTNILVFGDSHSADKVNAIKSTGYDVAQIGGAGCPLLPIKVFSRRSFCESLFTLAKSYKEADTIVLVRSFGKDELVNEYIQEVVDYWSPLYRKVILFTPMPVFSSLNREYIKAGTVEASPLFIADKKFQKILSEITLPENVTIIDTISILCGEERECQAMKDGQLLFTDQDHFSDAGAEFFGQRLMASDDWQEIIKR